MLTDTSTYLYLRAHNWWEDQEGQGLVEYALIIALVSIVLIGALLYLSGGLETIFEGISDQLQETR